MRKDLLVALSLGDGALVQTSPNLAKLVIRHSLHQKDYCEFKYNLEHNFWTKCPRSYENYIKDKKYFGVEIRSKGTQEIKQLRDMLYPNNKKFISRDILNYLTQEGLAIWFMDDGCIDRPLNKNSMGILNTYCNSPNAEEELIIQLYFKEKWDIEVAINKGHGRHRIRFNHPNFCKLVKIIEPYILESLKYKIDLTMRLSTPDSSKRG